MPTVPERYDDPFWISLAANAEKSNNLPPGLLKHILVSGERTNNSDISSASARTPFQIIPQTRSASIDEYGLDAWLSPENSAEVAGKILADSIKRNKGDVAAAVGEYHGGTNRKNWGPITKSYINRVMTGFTKDQQTQETQPKSTFDRYFQSVKQITDQGSAMAAVHSAYLAGKMTPEESAQYESDVKSGAVMLPQGALLKSQQPNKPKMLPQGVADAYVEGKMTPEERSALEQDLKNGLVELPAPIAKIAPGAGEGPVATTQGVIPQPPAPTIPEMAVGAGEAMLTTATGLTGGAAGHIAGTVEGITKSIMDGTFGTPEAAAQTARMAEERAASATYQPRTEQGVSQARAVSEIMAPLAALGPMTAELSQIGNAARMAGPAQAAIQSTMPRVAQAVETVQSIPGRVGEMFSRNQEPPTPPPGSVGAMGTTFEQQMEGKLSGMPVNIPVTKGDITREASQKSFEVEAAKNPELGKPLRQNIEEKNDAVIRNLEAFGDTTGGFLPTNTEAGHAVKNVLLKGLDDEKAKVRALYKDAEQAGQMEQPVALQSVLDKLNELRPEQEVAPILKVAEQKAKSLGIIRDVVRPDGAIDAVANPVPLRIAELFRRSIGDAIGFDPTNRKFGRDIISLVDSATEGMGGDLYKQARTARYEMAKQYEKKGIIANLVETVKGTDDPRIPADMVFNRSVLNAPVSDVVFLRDSLAKLGDEGKQAWAELQYATMRHIQEQATKNVGTDSQGRQMVSAAQLNRAVKQIDSNNRLDIILGKDIAQQVRDLNDIVKAINTAPPGTLINNSGTAGMLAAMMKQTMQLGGLNKIPGVGVMLQPILGYIADKKLSAKIQEALTYKPRF